MTTTDLRELELLIAGQTVPGAGEPRESVDPASERTWAIVRDASPDQVDAAVHAARSALRGGWGQTLPRERGRLLRRLATLIESNADRLIATEIRDNGKTIREVTAQYRLIPEFYRYFAELADKVDGRVLPPERPGVLNYTLVEPVGVVGAITPWNSPGLQLAFKAAPALAAGNALVVKPSEHTPVATLEHAELFAEAGFPSGVINVVTGAGEIGAALASHPGLDLVVFTGSDVTGRRVGAAAGGALSGSILELGGKSAQLVLPTPTWNKRSPAWQPGSARPRVRPASPGRARTWRPRSTPSSASAWPSASGRCESARRMTGTPKSVHSPSRPTATGLSGSASRPAIRALSCWLGAGGLISPACTSSRPSSAG